MLKAGDSEHGAAEAASHTGSLAGAAKVYSAAMEQAGITQATDLNDLFDSTLALSLQPTMKGDNLLILTNGGGVGVLATDAAEKYGLPLKFAPAEVQEEMKKHMPDFGSAKNPVDMTGMAGNDWYYETTKSAFAHPWVDGLVVLYCQTAITNPAEIAEAIHRGIKDAGVTDKPALQTPRGRFQMELQTQGALSPGERLMRVEFGRGQQHRIRWQSERIAVPVQHRGSIRQRR